MENVSIKKKNVYILGGMRFDKINAACHRSISLGKLFRNKGFNVELFGFSCDEIQCGFLYGFKYFAFKYPTSVKAWFSYSFSTKFYAQLLNKMTSDDILVVNKTIPSFVCLKIFKICSKRNVKVIFDVDEWYSYEFSNIIRSPIKNLDIWIKMHIICKKKMDFIVAGSFLKEHCNKHNGIFVFPAIVTEKNNISYNVSFDEVNASNDGRINLFFGGFISKNGKKETLEEVILAINEINSMNLSKKIHLNIAGPDGKSSDFIHYYGKLSYRDCICLLSSSDFSIIPRSKTRTNQAGFPTKLSESFLYSVPCIATDTSDVKDYLFTGINGFLVNKNEKNCYLEIFKEIISACEEETDYLKKAKERVLECNCLTLDRFEPLFEDFLKVIL